MTPEPSPANDFVEPEDIAAIPEVYRRIIARYLAQRATVRAGGLVPDNWAQAHNDALRGAAVDLAEPLAEDSTIMHAAEMLADLATDKEGVDAAGESTGVVSIGSAPYVALVYYSAALDEIYRLRAALAREAELRRDDLTLKTYPAGRRPIGQRAVERMNAAARGDVDGAYPGLDAKQALRTAGADEGFTHHDWKQHVDRAKQRTPEGSR